jgi:dihydrofolate synthase/folylpolyglutamate synthase
MDKKQALAFLKKLESRGMSLGLSRIEGFLALVGSPERDFASVHVAGTNGKGSTAAMLESILRKAGCKTGLYTSPHLVEFNERVRVNGKSISDRDFCSLVSSLKKELEESGLELTYFEFVTALAFKHFSEKKVEVAVVEVGMGGRLDATNVVMPLVSVITNVENEHEEHLGKTTKAIAREKAGIVKRGVPVLTAEWKKPVLRVFEKTASGKKARLVVVKRPWPGALKLSGSFQAWNAALAAAAARELESQGIRVGGKAIAEGLASAEWPGRFQLVGKRPLVVLDCAHNPACCVVLSRAFRETFPGRRALLVFGVSKDKKVEKMARVLAPFAKKVFVTASKTRPMPLARVQKAFSSQGIEAKPFPGVKKALKKALAEANPDDIVLVAGSCFVVGEAIGFLGPGP